MLKQRGFANILILLVIVAIAAVGTAYYFGFDHGFEKSVKNIAPTASPSPSTDETANWKTYSNEEYGFSFKHPNLIRGGNIAGALTKTEVNKVEMTFFGPSQLDPGELNDGISLNFNSGSLNGKTLEQLVDEKVAQLRYADYPTEKISTTIAGINAYTFNSPGLFDEHNFYVLKGSNSYLAISYEITSEKYQETVDQILSTFKFTP